MEQVGTINHASDVTFVQRLKTVVMRWQGEGTVNMGGVGQDVERVLGERPALLRSPDAAQVVISHFGGLDFLQYA